MNIRILLLLLLFLFTSKSFYGQLQIGNARSEINFREGPGINYKIAYTIDESNLLVILPREKKNGFVEVFDVETSSHGFISESLIIITDTLQNQKQKFFEESGNNATGDIEIALVNRTDQSVFVWINGFSYTVFPHEKKSLLITDEHIKYFCSSRDFFPVFGLETLKKGSIYQWDISL